MISEYFTVSSIGRTDQSGKTHNHEVASSIAEQLHSNPEILVSNPSSSIAKRTQMKNIHATYWSLNLGSVFAKLIYKEVDVICVSRKEVPNSN